MEWRGREWSGGEGRGGQGRVPDCLGGLSRVGISSRSTRPWNGQPPSITNTRGQYLVHNNSLNVSVINITCKCDKIAHVNLC